jgi:hypothetical protein
MIDDARMEKALDYLARTDEKCAELRSEVLRTEYLAKLKEAGGFLLAEGTVDERKSTAKVAPEVQSEWDLHFKAVAAYETMRARRERAVLTVEAWRSYSANRRAGNI